jgi:hypothetical protein
VPPRNSVPVVTITLGVDAIVGETAADFVDAGPAERRPPAPAQSAATEPSPFAKELAGRVDPVRNRLLEEAARLDLVRRAALDYVDRAGSPPEPGT